MVVEGEIEAIKSRTLEAGLTHNRDTLTRDRGSA
jgi:hypothetical protein